MKETTKDLVLRMCILIAALVICFMTLSNLKTKAPTVSPTPTSTPVVVESDHRAAQYVDIMTKKCYNEQEKEVPCKG